MPKMKTHRGAAKRFSLTSSGKVRFNKRNRRHILTKKSPGRKRRLRQPAILSKADTPTITRLIGG